VNDAQIWTVIGAFSAIMIGGFALMMNVLKSEIGGVRAEIGGLRGEMDSRFTTIRGEIDARFTALDEKLDQRIDNLSSITAARFTDVDHRLESIETDMHLIKRHLIGQRSA